MTSLRSAPSVYPLRTLVTRGRSQSRFKDSMEFGCKLFLHRGHRFEPATLYARNARALRGVRIGSADRATIRDNLLPSWADELELSSIGRPTSDEYDCDRYNSIPDSFAFMSTLFG